MRQEYSFLGQNSLSLCPLRRTNSVKLRALSGVDMLFVTVSFEGYSLARNRTNADTTFSYKVCFLFLYELEKISNLEVKVNANIAVGIL
jgi:hypothetical protein